MHVVIIVLTVIVAVLLMGIVLIQKSKGGGLSSQLGGAGSVMGVRQTNSFLEKATWTLAAVLVLLSIASAYTLPKKGQEAAPRTEVAEQPAMPTGNQFGTPAAKEEAPAAPAAATEASAETAEAPAAE